jgi:NCS1 family nucleobase:cation symporter-1
VGSIQSWHQFFEMGRKVVWTGATPDGSPPMGFWKVAAFAWICNLAMHGGLSDMALFRFARRSSYGLFSAFGMFLGHYLAWICAGLMGVGAALVLQRPLPELDAGEVAYQALGWAGAIAVIIAGWTTSNPTLYRAGLAFQAITPNWSRAKVTLVTGLVTTVIACFPFVFTKLLDFVGIYGLLLAPAGAIVVTEHWIFPRLGLTRYWASQMNVALNWPALIAWTVAIAMALVLQATGVLHLFFLFLPVYVLTSVLYLGLAWLFGARMPSSRPDQAAAATAEVPAARAAPAGGPADHGRWPVRIAGLVALVALIMCLILPIWVCCSRPDQYTVNLATVRTWLLVPTLVYFVAATVFYHGVRGGRVSA